MRLLGLAWMILGSAIFLIWGCSMASRSHSGMCDFDTVYYHARVLIERGDPYVESAARYECMRLNGYLDPKNTSQTVLPILPCVYPPTTLIVSSPLALLTWRAAHFVWMALLSCAFLLAAFMVWHVSAAYAPLLSGVLIGSFIAN